MALSFPLALADFYDLLPILSMSCDPGEALDGFATGDGEFYTATYGTRLWRGGVTLNRAYHWDHDAIDARLSILRESGNRFLMCRKGHEYPRLDPDGSILGASSVTINSVIPGNRELTLTGLPAGYVISAGDHLSFDYGTPTRRAFHRVVVGKTANGSGVTTAIEVTPTLRNGAAAGLGVTLKRPTFCAKIAPGSYQPGTSAKVFTSGPAFQFIQTLRLA